MKDAGWKRPAFFYLKQFKIDSFRAIKRVKMLF